MRTKHGRGDIPVLRVKATFLRIVFLGVATAFLCFLLPARSIAHSGGLDKDGCHNNNTKHDFECHSGLLKGQIFKSQAEAMKALEKKRKEVAANKKSPISTAKTQNSQKPSPTGGK